MVRDKDFYTQKKAFSLKIDGNKKLKALGFCREIRIFEK
jgi:hypothetical protein